MRIKRNGISVRIRTNWNERGERMRTKRKGRGSFDQFYSSNNPKPRDDLFQLIARLQNTEQLYISSPFEAYQFVKCGVR